MSPSSPLPSQAEWRDALVRRHGPDRQEKFSSACVAICGLGGLGSHIASALARAGVGTLLLLDFDRVDLTNLHRQQYKASQIGQPKPQALAETLLEIAPYLHAVPVFQRVTGENALSLLAPAHIVCEAFDNPEAKALLANTVLEIMPDKYLVAASGMAGIGSANTIQTRRITRRFYLCGDGVSEVSPSEGLFSTRVMACAAHQAHMVLRILAGEQDP